MAKGIAEIEGIGKVNGGKLSKAGVTSVNKLLTMCCDRKGRNAVSKATGIDAKKILKWVNMADLFRIKGVGKQYAELLEAAGVDTVKELSKRKPENLHAKIEEVHAKARKKLVRKTPGAVNVGKWVAEAKKLKPMVSH